MRVEAGGEEVRVVHPTAAPPVRPDTPSRKEAPRRLDLPTVAAREKKPDSPDVVELSAQERVSTDYQYEVSETQDLVVKVVNAKDRSEVIRQYPSEDVLKFRSAYREFLNLVGLAP
ncbi:MAG: flagellar protein FlaG [Nitrospinae bacterium]|nr:flagellar protein FlaG [Nitrospinota bacterium]